jgi:hypothetical protein
MGTVYLGFHSPVLYEIATDAAERIPGDSSRIGGSPNALVAVMFAAATLEAFINEIALFAKLRTDGPPVLSVLATLLEELEEAQGHMRAKYQLARGVLTGAGFDRGTKPFQDFELLVRLRNEIVHMKAQLGLIPVGPSTPNPKLGGVATRLQSLKLLAEYETDTQATWVHMASTRATAEWACKTARAMVSATVDSLPDSQFKEQFGALVQRLKLV